MATVQYYAKKKEGAASSSSYYSSSNRTNVVNTVTGGSSDHAASADYATNAGHADTADTATNAGHATTADKADKLTNARTLWGQSFDGTQNVSGDISGAGDITASGLIHTLGNLQVGGTSSLQVVNSNDVIPNANDTYNLGSSGKRWLNAWINTLYSNNINNADKITTKDLTVTGSAHFFELIIDKIKAAGGAVLFTPADGFTVDKVVSVTDGYKLYWRARDNDGNQRDNMWQVGDQAICKSFNQAKVGTSHNVSNKNYWCLVTSVSEQANYNNNDGNYYHYIVISKTTKEGTVNPEVGDAIAMLGHRITDSDKDAQGNVLSSAKQRQSAIYISAYESLDTGITAPLIAQYRGIDDFNLSSHRKSYFDANSAEFIGNFKVSTDNGDTTIKDYIDNNMPDNKAPFIGTGGVVNGVQTESGYWYYWDGTTWVKGVKASADGVEQYILSPYEESLSIAKNGDVGVSLKYKIYHTVGSTATELTTMPEGFELALYDLRSTGTSDKYDEDDVVFAYENGYWSFLKTDFDSSWYTSYNATINGTNTSGYLLGVSTVLTNNNNIELARRFISIQAKPNVIFEVDADNAQIHSKIDSYESQLDGYSDKVTEYTNKYSEFTQTVNGFRTDVGNYTTAYNNINGTMLLYGEEYSNFTQRASSIETSVNSTNSKYDEVSGRLKTVEDNMSDVKQTADSITSTVESRTLKLNPYNLIPNPTEAYSSDWYCDSVYGGTVQTDGKGMFWCNNSNFESNGNDLCVQINVEKGKRYKISLDNKYTFSISINNNRQTNITSYTYTATADETIQLNFFNAANTPLDVNGKYSIYRPVVTLIDKPNTWYVDSFDYTASEIKQTADEIKLAVNNAGILLTSEEITAKAHKFTIQNSDGTTTFKVDDDGQLVGGTEGGFVANNTTVRVGTTATNQKSYAEMTTDNGNGIIRTVYNQGGTAKEGVKLTATQNGGIVSVKGKDDNTSTLSYGSLSLSNDLYLSVNVDNCTFKFGGIEITATSDGIQGLKINTDTLPTQGTQAYNELSKGCLYRDGNYLMVKT